MQRTGKTGKSYVTTTVKAAAADNASSDFWNVLAFRDTAQAALMRLAIGERVTVQGSLKLELYSANDGAQKISRTVFADHVMALRQPPKERKAAKPAPSTAGPSSDGESSTDKAAPSSFYSDDIPF